MRIKELLTVLALALAGAGLLAISCTEGTTPDCTGDAAVSCGPLPNEGGNEESSTGEGGSDDGATDSSMTMMDSSMVTVDSSTDDAGEGGDDSGEAGD